MSESQTPPVVTPGAANTVQEGGTSDLLSMLRSRLAEAYGERPSGQQQISDFLMNMGTRLMASRAPRPQAFGEALRGAYEQRQADQRQQLQDMSKALENESTARYREAQIRVEEAKQRWQENPQNPQAIYQLAHARQAEAAARNQLAQAAAAGQGRFGAPMVMVNRETGEQRLFYPRPGEQPPAGFDFQRSAQQEDNLAMRRSNNYLSAYQRAMQRLATRPENFGKTEEQLHPLASAEAERAVVAAEEMLARLGRRPGSPAPAGPSSTNSGNSSNPVVELAPLGGAR